MDIKFYLPEMSEGEEIKIFVRKHLMFLAAPLSSIAAMIILPSVGIFVLVNLSSFFNQSPVKNFVILIISCYLLIMCGIALFVWFRYYYSYLIVTNLRLIEIEQKSLFNRVISTSELIRVEDVKALVRGVLATFLRYGDVLVETAGAGTENFLFEKIPNASYVANQILELSQKSLEKHVPEIGGRMASFVHESTSESSEEKINLTNKSLEGSVNGFSKKFQKSDETYSNLDTSIESVINNKEIKGNKFNSEELIKQKQLEQKPLEQKQIEAQNLEKDLESEQKIVKNYLNEQQSNKYNSDNQDNKIKKTQSKILYERDKDNSNSDLSGSDTINTN